MNTLARNEGRLANEELLAVRSLGKRFGGIQALAGVEFSIRRGEIYGLIGPNGAGKTTLFNLITGIYPPDAGSVLFEGQALGGLKPNLVAKRGIARTFQNIRLFANLSALENVMIGRHVRTHTGVLGAVLRHRAAREEEAGIERRALELLAFVGIAQFANAPASTLAYGDQRRLEIARALATDPILLALDEPAAGMNASESGALRSLLQAIRATGVTLLLIEHDMRLVMSLCDRVLVLDYGERIAEGTPREVQADARVISAYLGGGTNERP
jgi:branched-chain amino acid transport system ATP-binding protein